MYIPHVHMWQQEPNNNGLKKDICKGNTKTKTDKMFKTHLADTNE